jgi:5-methylcytosine-specific restriction endonuclease McrA
LRQRRAQALKALGGKCLLCGEFDQRLLDIEHLREGSGERTSAAISRVLTGDLSNLQVLCVACHRIKTLEGMDMAQRFAQVRRRFVALCKGMLRLARP